MLRQILKLKAELSVYLKVAIAGGLNCAVFGREK
jgi:hypothetical protein